MDHKISQFDFLPVRNVTGEIMARNVEQVGTSYAVLQAIKSAPIDIVKKICICSTNLKSCWFLRYIDSLSENSFRSVKTGRLNKDLQLVMELNNILRERNQIEWRTKYVPKMIMKDEMHYATLQTERTWIELDRQKRLERCGGFNLLDDID